jgi:cytidine deaminase
MNIASQLGLHTPIEGRAPVRGSMFTTKATTLQASSSELTLGYLQTEKYMIGMWCVTTSPKHFFKTHIEAKMWSLNVAWRAAQEQSAVSHAEVLCRRRRAVETCASSGAPGAKLRPTT